MKIDYTTSRRREIEHIFEEINKLFIGDEIHRYVLTWGIWQEYLKRKRTENVSVDKSVTPTITVSKCCGANYSADSSDEGTFTNVCKQCGEDCDIILKEYFDYDEVGDKE